MRTGRSLTVCCSLLPGGVSALGGVCSRGRVCSGGVSAPVGSGPRGVCIPACTAADTLPPVNRILDTCLWKYYLGPTSLGPVKNVKSARSDRIAYREKLAWTFNKRMSELKTKFWFVSFHCSESRIQDLLSGMHLQRQDCTDMTEYPKEAAWSGIFFYSWWLLYICFGILVTCAVVSNHSEFCRFHVLSPAYDGLLRLTPKYYTCQYLGSQHDNGDLYLHTLFNSSGNWTYSYSMRLTGLEHTLCLRFDAQRCTKHYVQ